MSKPQVVWVIEAVYPEEGLVTPSTVHATLKEAREFGTESAFDFMKYRIAKYQRVEGRRPTR